jgi:hypothetical protein
VTSHTCLWSGRYDSYLVVGNSLLLLLPRWLVSLCDDQYVVARVANGMVGCVGFMVGG